MPLNIQVGQQWRTRGGEVVTIAGRDENTDTPYVWDLSNGESVNENGHEVGDSRLSSNDLIELVAAAPSSQRLADILIEEANRAA